MTSVVVIGKNRLAVGCLEAVVHAGDEVVLAVADPSDDGSDGWQPSFLAAARRLGLPTSTPPDVNHGDFVSEVRQLSPEFILSFQAAQILKPALIEASSKATMNLHFGLLPRYRGVAPIAWAIINGEQSTGVTLHHIDPGIDSGEVVASAEVAIGRDDTGRSLYDKCTEAGIVLFSHAWSKLRAGQISGQPQAESDALYYNRHSIDFTARRINWSWDAERLANWIRAFIFPPFQFPSLVLGDGEYDVTSVEQDREAHRGRPGQVLEVEGDRILVGVPGGRLRLGPLVRGGLALEGSALTARGFVRGAVLPHG